MPLFGSIKRTHTRKAFSCHFSAFVFVLKSGMAYSIASAMACTWHWGRGFAPFLVYRHPLVSVGPVFTHLHAAACVNTGFLYILGFWYTCITHLYDLCREKRNQFIRILSPYFSKVDNGIYLKNNELTL